MKVIYKKQIWKLICPGNLKFPPGIIRNILIENDKGSRLITNVNQIKRVRHKSIISFF